MTEFKTMIGKRIRELREKRGYSRETLAGFAKISDKHLYYIETGKKSPSAYNFLSLANSLGVTMDYLVSEKQGNDDFSRVISLLKNLSPDELDYVMGMIQMTSTFLKSHCVGHNNLAIK